MKFIPTQAAINNKPVNPVSGKTSLTFFISLLMLGTSDISQANQTTAASVAVSNTAIASTNNNAKAGKKNAVGNKKSTKNNNEPIELDAMVVTEPGRAKDLIGITGSASQGEVSQKQFEYRPLSRNGEILEVVPGVLATQHSGSGKANQYFLRGFNLDHGTDFTTYVDGIPMNMVTHAHGQGYMDLNSIIPELVSNIEYGKGPYYAEVGDFSAAGYSSMYSMDKLDQGILKLSAGQYDYYRGLVANSNKIGKGNLLYAGEFTFYNGVWVQPEDSKKINGMLRYTLNEDKWGIALNAKAYHNTWTATNQVPQTAVDNSLLGLYGTMDPTDGGNSSRYSFSGNLWNKGNNWKNNANIYTLYYDVNLFSNFTGYLANPVQGDQFHQFEHRMQSGGNVEHTRYNKLFGFDMDNTAGLQIRSDQIMGLGLNNTYKRQYLSTVNKSNVNQYTIGFYLKNQTYWHEKFRSIAGLRADYINNEVTQTDNTTHDPLINALNSGNSSRTMLSPKLSLVFGPWLKTEYFINGGYGYHSNDARGTVLTVNPVDGSKVNGDGMLINPATPLAWSRGAEAGIRSNIIPKLNTTLAVWWLNSSQELVFTGDEGTTSINGSSTRYGVEWTNYYKPTSWLTLDADFAFTSARYTTRPDGESSNYIPNSVGRVISVGATAVAPNGLFGTVRLRSFGEVPLDPSGIFWAGSTNIVNMGTGYQYKKFKVELDLFNVFGSTQNDIAYAYQNAYPAGAQGEMGIMKHPVEPRMIRGTITFNF